MNNVVRSFQQVCGFTTLPRILQKRAVKMRMKEVVLSQLTDHRVFSLVEEMGKLETTKGRVYCTTVSNTFDGVDREPGSSIRPGTKAEHFVTTSKDVHLMLGQLSEEGQGRLAWLIRCSLAGIGDGLVIFMNPEKKAALFATLQIWRDDELVIHLEPAR